MSPNRRNFLAGVAISITSVGTGCVGSINGGGSEPTLAPMDETARPAATTVASSRTNMPPVQTRTTDSSDAVPVVEPPACDGTLRRLSIPLDGVRYDSLSGFTLTVSQKTATPGESVTFRLENKSDTIRPTGNDELFDIQHRTGGGWRSVYRIADGPGYSGETIPQRRGEGFTWRFALSRDGLEHATQFNTPYSVCEDLTPGEYRFVYWGVSSKEEHESDFEKEYAIGVRFSIVRS